MKKTITIFLVLILNLAAFAQTKTVVSDARAEQMLVGKHRLSLQWISWDYFGAADVTKRDGVYYLKGSQKSRTDDDYLTIDGVIESIDAKEFRFNGKIVSKVSHINGGAPCERSGRMTFAATKNRKYWRLQEMDNPCDGVTDYVDVFFR